MEIVMVDCHNFHLVLLGITESNVPEQSSAVVSEDETFLIFTVNHLLHMIKITITGFQ